MGWGMPRGGGGKGGGGVPLRLAKMTSFQDSLWREVQVCTRFDNKSSQVEMVCSGGLLRVARFMPIGHRRYCWAQNGPGLWWLL